MKLAVVCALLCGTAVLDAAPPSITELQPRGAQKGRPFKLTVSGMYLGEGASVVSTLPATFTAIGIGKTERPDKTVAFLVEPTADWAVGVYPMRIQAANGISNILLFTIGAFPELMEEESRAGSLPHQNDTIERAQTIPSGPITLNGTLKGPERDFFRIQAKAGEKRVFEVEARRCGSAVDPVLRVYDAGGKRIAVSQDDPVLSLDPRLAITFPKEGYYYVEVHDARFSTQTDNFYRLKTGAYEYASDIFPLGGRRGEQVSVSLNGATPVKADLTATKAPQTFVNLPNSPALPLPLAIGDFPEALEPVQGPLSLPITVNGRLAQPGEVDKYELAVSPGEEFLIKLQARELGTSKIMGLLTAYDEKGKKLASAGDGPLPVDVAAVQVSSRTQGDPVLQFKVPEGVQRVSIAVEDLARRGGTHYAYRLMAYKAPFDLQATISTPYVNIPAGGTALVNVVVERQGYMGRLRLEALNVPKGVSVAGGDIPAEVPDPNNRATSRRAMLTLTADQEVRFPVSEIGIQAVALDAQGGPVQRAAKGLGFAIGVAGATAQGVVDRQRPLTGAWLGHELPTALTDPSPANLLLTLESTAKKESGYEFRFRWRWQPRNAMLRVPETVSPEVPNFIDLRVIEMAVDAKDKNTGTFLVTSTKNTLPALYNIMVTGRLMAEGGERTDVYSPIMSFTLPALESEEKKADASAVVAR